MKRMTKIFLLVMVLALALIIVACGESKSRDTVSVQDAAAENTEVTEADNESVAPNNNDNTIVLGQPITLGDVEMTITELSIVNDYLDNPGLKVTYEWTNNSNEEAAPFTTFSLIGFQDNTKTRGVLVSNDVDLGLGQKEVKPGETITAVDGIVIADMSKPMLLELSGDFPFDDVVYSMTIKDLSSLE